MVLKKYFCKEDFIIDVGQGPKYGSANVSLILILPS